ncbi:MAG: protein-glutamate O-methyltransferase CheR [Deltaproteobacteria bacterium]|nr:protein-glutamate O-methyltransferase CheR [Deltaproteobacteria bacterium]
MTPLQNTDLQKIVRQIKETSGVDLSHYRTQILTRRITAHLNKKRPDSINDYIKLIATDPNECRSLVESVTIHVTEFFRNPEIFEDMKKTVIPGIIYSKRNRQHKIIRLWSCACSSGDEPYSLAMLLIDELGAAIDNFNITIIGTDIDAGVLYKARDMQYPSKRLEGLDKKIINRHFTPCADGRFTLNDAVKKQVRFTQHDVITDRMFTFCDAILCRNLFIYFDKGLQEKIQIEFFNCLNPGGYLILGMSESLVGAAAELYEKVNPRLRIYKKPETKFLSQNSKQLSQEEINLIVKALLAKQP